MPKIGRNDLCNCGSGPKYKRCHGSIVNPANSPGNLPVDQRNINLGALGFSGDHQHLHVVSRFREGDPRNSLPVEGSQGLYIVTFVLNRPGYELVPERRYSFAEGLKGNSHLAISKPAFLPPNNPDADRIDIFAITEDGTFTFEGFPNAHGFLGKLISKPFVAMSKQDAEQKAFRALSSSLSDMSLHLDIPLSIYQRETKEVVTGNIQLSIITPEFEAPLAINPSSNLIADFRGVASLYREAMNTNSPVYKYLCLYKIIEALSSRRTNLERKANQAGTKYLPPVEVLPSTDAEVRIWLAALFYTKPEWDLMALQSAVPTDVRGMEISKVISDILRPLRVNVAHGLIGKKGDLTLSADELLHSQQVTFRLSMTKCIARRMLKNDFPDTFLTHLPG